MPDVSGLDLIREIVGAAPESERPQIVMMTAHATIERAIEAMKLGALARTTVTSSTSSTKPSTITASWAEARRCRR